MKTSNYVFTTEISSPMIRGTDEPRPWDLEKLILKACASHKNLLDIGCGTAFKIIPFCDKLRFIVGLEINKKLLLEASKNIQAKSAHNILLTHGSSELLPFADNQFDIVTVMLAPLNTLEIYRVLKPGGLVIAEKISDHDKKELKQLFGKDDFGWRGYLYTGDTTHPQKDSIETSFKRVFSKVSIQNGFWKTYYTLENLVKLLEETPTIRNFDKVLDRSILDKVVESYMTEKGIGIIQNRLLVIAEK